MIFLALTILQLYNPPIFWEEYWSEIDETRETELSVSLNPELAKIHYERIASVIHPYVKEGDKVLDVGTGAGFWAVFFERMGCFPLAVDIAASSVMYVREKGIDAVLCDVADDSSIQALLPRGPFSIISAMNVLHHIVDDERFRNAIENCSALIDDGGYLFITSKFDTLLSMSHSRPFAYKKYRPLDVWIKVLKRYKFRVVEYKVTPDEYAGRELCNDVLIARKVR